MGLKKQQQEKDRILPVVNDFRGIMSMSSRKSKELEAQVSTSHNNFDNVSPCSRDGWRNLLAFWVLGLCNNYGYVVMLSAAHDILHQGDEVS